MSSPREQTLEDNFTVAQQSIFNDDISILKHVLNSFPQCCTLVDKNGNNLLQLSVALKKYETFEYLLSLKRFDVNTCNNDGKSALVIALTSSEDVSDTLDEYFAIELIKCGAEICTVYHGNTLLHLALWRHYFKTARLLLEKGVDMNVQNDHGCTPLHMIFHIKDDPHSVNEGVGLMLFYGADPTIFDNNGNLPFELAVTYHPDIVTTQEHLFHCTFDSFSYYRMSMEVLFELLESSSPLFYQVAEIASEVVFVKGLTYCPTFFLRIKPEFLQVMIKKFDYVISNLLEKDVLDPLCDYQPGNMQNWEILLHSHLASDAFDLIRRLRIDEIIYSCIDNDISSEKGFTFIYFLLSYGLCVDDSDLEVVYKFYNYCDLFKTLLHMDIERSKCNIVPRLFYDIQYDIVTFLEDPHDFSLSALEVLLRYFAHPRLKAFCLRLGVNRLEFKASQLPKVPLLVEFARDATRKFLVTRYNIHKTSQIFTLLKWLPIARTHQKILSFERRLYEDVTVDQF